MSYEQRPKNILTLGTLAKESDKAFKPFRADFTGAQISMDLEHHKVHEGDAFTVRWRVLIPRSTSDRVLIQTPDTVTRYHMTMKFENQSELRYRFYVDGDFDTIGTDIMNNVNRDLNNSNTSNLVITLPSIPNTYGSLLFDQWHGNGKTFGGEIRSIQELILKNNSSHIIRLTEESGSDNMVNFTLSWYELAN